MEQEFDRVVQLQGLNVPDYERKQLLNQLLRDLENDFYVAESPDGKFDFASGLLKAWWTKYYA